ncbi:MAG: hypothetical protein WCL02_01075 [bacterium]
MIILVLFILSFLLFVISLYFTFIKDKKAEELASSTEITNIDTGNIDYTKEVNVEIPESTDTEHTENIHITNSQTPPNTVLNTDTQ